MNSDNFNMPENGQRPVYVPESLVSWRRRRDEREANRRYVAIPNISLDGFAYYTENENNRFGGIAQRIHWTCHNCGSIGWKLGRVNELFKCYCCRSRNLTIIKAGDLSRLVRDGHLGIKMEDIYRERQERQAVQRRERTEHRRAARRNQ